MLENLLESRATRGRSFGGVLTSITAHTALIGAALYATAQARVAPAGIPEIVRPFFIPPAPSIARATPTPKPQRTKDARQFNFIEPRFDLRIPVVDISAAVSTSLISKPGDFAPGRITAHGIYDGMEDGAVTGDTPLRADQVEQQVSVVRGNAPPQYPEVLRNSGVEGQVTALFIVDEQGRAEESSVRFLRSDNRLFEEAVRVALRRMRFNPALVAGRKVRQLVQMPFVFTLAR